MKKYFILILLAFNATAFAQFKLSGKIAHYAGNESVAINIPVVSGFFDENIINVPIAKNGSFNISLPVTKQKFAYLMFQSNNYPLLLNINKNLDIELDVTGKGIKIIKGNAQAENDLIQKINLLEQPSFLLDDRFTRLDINALNSQLLKPYLTARDRKIAQVNQSMINPADKKLIAAEINYIAYNNLYELTDIGAENPAALNKLVSDTYSKASVKPEAMPAGPHYYVFANNYLKEMEKIAPGKPSSIITRWESALKYLPLPVAEQFGYHLITRAFYNGDTNGKLLSNAYLKKFPAGVYTKDVKAKAAKLK